MRKLLVLSIIASVLAGCQHGGKSCHEYKGKLEVPVYFAFDKSDITPQAKANLDEGVEFLRKHRFRRIRIDAYADQLGNEEYNKKITEKRANAIRDYIISKGVAEKRIYTQWHGIEKGDNYKEHRRVNVTVL